MLYKYVITYTVDNYLYKDEKGVVLDEQTMLQVKPEDQETSSATQSNVDKAEKRHSPNFSNSNLLDFDHLTTRC